MSNHVEVWSEKRDRGWPQTDYCDLVWRPEQVGRFYYLETLFRSEKPVKVPVKVLGRYQVTRVTYGNLNLCDRYGYQAWNGTVEPSQELRVRLIPTSDGIESFGICVFWMPAIADNKSREVMIDPHGKRVAICNTCGEVFGLQSALSTCPSCRIGLHFKGK